MPKAKKKVKLPSFIKKNRVRLDNSLDPFQKKEYFIGAEFTDGFTRCNGGFMRLRTGGIDG